MDSISTIPSINFSTIEMFKTDVPKIFLLNVTPEIATEMLSTSSGNRKLNTPNVLNLKAEMTNGEYDWRTGETIKFNNNGVLKDGHHRLKAVIESGTTQTMLVFIGAVKSEKMDTGKSRSMADSLVMSDNGEYNNIAKLAVNILRLKNGYPLSNVGYKKEIPLTEIITLCKTEKKELEQIGGSKFKWLMKKAFPSYSRMKEIYLILRKKGGFILLPLCYIHRVFYYTFVVRNKTKEKIDSVNKIDNSSDKDKV